MPVPSPELSPTTEMVSPQAAKDVVQHCGGHPSDTAAPEQPEPESLTRTVTLRLGPAHSTHGPSAATTSPHTQRSLMFLEREAHNVRLKIGQKEMEGKGTGKCYPHQVWNYRVWFEEEQSRITAGDPSRTALPAFPITAAKVAAFLHNESTREKVSLTCALSPCHLTERSCLMQLKRGSRSKTVEGSSLGKSHIAQVVNALENHRLNHEHEYPRDHETQVSLRKDVRIHTFEPALKHNEPSRIEKSQAIKAARTTSGVSSQLATTSIVMIADGDAPDMYSKEELFWCSLWALTDFLGKHHVFVGLRDCVMLLLSVATVFCGESCRMLHWSDLFRTMAPLDQMTEVEVSAPG